MKRRFPKKKKKKTWSKNPFYLDFYNKFWTKTKSKNYSFSLKKRWQKPNLLTFLSSIPLNDLIILYKLKLTNNSLQLLALTSEGQELVATGLEELALKLHPLQPDRVQETLHQIHADQDSESYVEKENET